MKIFIKIENDIISDICFKTFGCGAAAATSSMVTEMAKGKTVREAHRTREGSAARMIMKS